VFKRGKKRDFAKPISIKSRCNPPRRSKISCGIEQGGGDIRRQFAKSWARSQFMRVGNPQREEKRNPRTFSLNRSRWGGKN